MEGEIIADARVGHGSAGLRLADGFSVTAGNHDQRRPDGGHFPCPKPQGQPHVVNRDEAEGDRKFKIADSR